MGAISDLLESLLVTPVTPEKKRCNRMQAAPPAAVTRVTPVTTEKSKCKTETLKRPVLTFTIDGTQKRITAIDMVAITEGEALQRLRDSWGNHLLCVWNSDGQLLWKEGGHNEIKESSHN